MQPRTDSSSDESKEVGQVFEKDSHMSHRVSSDQLFVHVGIKG
jgi:hypothetical protein